MTHQYVLQGTVGGGIAPRELELSMVTNISVVGNQTLEYVHTNQLVLTRVTNSSSFGSPTLTNVTVENLTLTRVTNASTFGGQQLVNLPFVPDNTETTALLDVFDGEYSTTAKIQMDTLIGSFKSGGIWSKLDWYGNAYWATTEHDALINWVDPAKTLTKVGTASWSQGVGLSGVNPVTSNSRYKSGWNIGDGPHSSSTDISFFCKITDIAVPQNGMLPMGVWQLVTGGGPATPDGMFLSLSIVANSGFAGANLQSGNGNTSFAPGDGLGVWGVAHSGSSQITVKNGSTLETDTVSGSSGYTDSDGMSVAGSAGLAHKSFPGTQIYWGWGRAFSASEFASIEADFAAAQEPPSSGPGPLVTSYSNPGGTGDRRSLIDISFANFTMHGDITNLIDGTPTTDNFFWSVNGVNAQITYHFVLGKQLIDEAKWYQDTSDTNGTFQWEGSNDGSTYTAIGGTFTLGGSATQTQTTLNGNTTPYEWYRMRQTSGSVSSNPFLREIEFKIVQDHEPANSVQSYFHPGGYGDRSASITVTATLIAFGSGVFSNLVDGVYGRNDTDSVAFGNLQTTGNIIFDFGTSRIVDEAICAATANNSHGTWQISGSNDNVSYTNIGTTFTWQATAQAPAASFMYFNELHGNTTAYRYYKFDHTTGNTSFVPFQTEMFFRIHG